MNPAHFLILLALAHNALGAHGSRAADVSQQRTEHSRIELAGVTARWLPLETSVGGACVSERIRRIEPGDLGPSLRAKCLPGAWSREWSLKALPPVTADFQVTTGFEIDRESVASMFLPGMNGRVNRVTPDDAGAFPARYVMGAPDVKSVPGSTLALPAVGLKLTNGLALGLALDPFHGAELRILPGSGGWLRVEVSTPHPGSRVPVSKVERSLALVTARDPMAAMFGAFYATVPQIQPGPAWLHDIRLVYYDYLSDGGQGWFRDIDELSRRILLKKDRAAVLLCLHGWFDYLGRYAFDERTGRLDKQWTAFPGSRKIPMSQAGLHRRLRYARERGFRVALYFADGVLADDQAPGFDVTRIYVDAGGRTNFPVWHGPDTIGANRYQDPSHPEVRRHYVSRLKAMIREFGRDADAFVWDETFYIRRGWVSARPGAAAAHADQAMMTLVAELTQLTQSMGRGRLAFLVSDSQGTDPYGLKEPTVPTALVAHGTYQDTGGSPGAWAGNLLPNFRNVLFSCMWEPIQHPDWNRINVERWGQPQALSNGWGDDAGPAEMAERHPAQLDDILRRFQAGTTTRVRYLLPSE